MRNAWLCPYLSLKLTAMVRTRTGERKERDTNQGTGGAGHEPGNGETGHEPESGNTNRERIIAYHIEPRLHYGLDICLHDVTFAALNLSCG